MKLNKKPETIFTHEGAKAVIINPKLQLRRSVMACMLWEDEFYEDGESIADRIKKLIPLVNPEVVGGIAIEAREKMHLRHVPLLIVREMARLSQNHHLVDETLYKIIQRPDELTEFLAIYWKDGKEKLSAQVKNGLRMAFTKFNAFQLAKYNHVNSKIKLRDVIRLVHPKPPSDELSEVYRKLSRNEGLFAPDTWESALVGGADKKQTFERLISEGKLGGMAFLRNLRNMKESGVSEEIIFEGFEKMKTDKILPFRFISAAKYAPQWENKIEKAMLKCLEGKEKLPGKTALVIDGSGSMFGTPISEKSEIDRFEAAAALTILAREICQDVCVIVFSNHAYLVPARHGFGLRDVLREKAEGQGTNTQNGILKASQEGYDRIIIVTDEQSHQSISNPLIDTKGYVVNVASYKNGIGYGRWVHIDGWSEAVLDYIRVSESDN